MIINKKKIFNIDAKSLQVFKFALFDVAGLRKETMEILTMDSFDRANEKKWFK